MSESNATTNDLSPDYPPVPHILRDLGIVVEMQGLDCRAGLEVVSHMCSEAGGMRIGTMSMLVDVVAGAYATRAVAPNWVATCDMVVHQFAAPARGIIAAFPRVLRHGKSTIVVEIDVTCQEEPEVLIGLGRVTFSILESRNELQRTEPREEFVRSEFAVPGSGLVNPVLEQIGAKVLSAGNGEVELAISPYVGNTLGALQGGVLSMLLDRSAELAGRRVGQADWATSDLAIHFLSLGKAGPLRSHARVLKSSPNGAKVRVEVRDEGRDHRLVSVATADVGPSSK